MADDAKPNRRSFLHTGSLVVLGGIAGAGLLKSGGQKLVWQIDPDLCTQCGRCATECVLSPSAVKCVHAFAMCGYCKLCGGYHQPNIKILDTAAENQLCPTKAIQRRYIENPYFEYTIDETLCIGCAKCVKGCGSFGNGSLHLQIRHDRCVNCNECSIAVLCPAGAFKRVPAENPYLIRGAVIQPKI